MTFKLLMKEFRENSARGSRFTRIFHTCASLLFLAILIAVEVIFFVEADAKILPLGETACADFLILLLFIIFVFSLPYAAQIARKALFRGDDTRILLSLPINPTTAVTAKIIYVYLKCALLLFLTSFPLLISFGVLHSLSAGFYVGSVFYAFLIALTSSGLGSLVALPIEKIFRLVKKRFIIQAILAIGLMIGLCYLYRFALDYFLRAVGNESDGNLFSQNFLDNLHGWVRYLYPVSGLMDGMLGFDNLAIQIVAFLLITIGVSAIGNIGTALMYSSFLKTDDADSSEVYPAPRKPVLSPVKALLKKEVISLFRNGNYLFSYTSVLVMQPFLSYLVIAALNATLYRDLSILLVYFPELVNGVSLAIVLLFATFVQTAASDGLRREKGGIVVSKTVPIAPVKQALCKLLIPTVASFTSYLVSLCVLLGFGGIDYKVFSTGLVLGAVLIVCMGLIGLYTDIGYLSAENAGKGSMASMIGGLVSIGLPILVFVLHFVLTFLKVQASIIYPCEIALSLVFLIPLVCAFPKVVNKGWLDMEVR